MKTVFLRCSVVMLVLVSLSGCVIGPNGQVRSQGTVTAVNASEQTVQIKTDEGQPLNVMLAKTTVLRDGDRLIKTKATLDQISAGKYLVAQCSKSPEGKLIADWAYVFNQRPENLRGASPTTAAATPTAASTTGSTIGPNPKLGETNPTNKAVIYIYRLHSGTAAPAELKANGQVLTTMTKGKYYRYFAEPGGIEFTEKGGPMHCSFTLNTTAGQTYYLKSTVYTGSYFPIMLPAVKLELVSPEVGASEISNCQLIP